MTGWRKRTIMEMAQEAGICRAENNTHWAAHGYELEAFAELVRADERNRTWTQQHWTDYERSIAAAEREKCADVVESTPWSNWFRTDCASAIRARGQA